MPDTGCRWVFAQGRPGISNKHLRAAYYRRLEGGTDSISEVSEDAEDLKVSL